MSAVDLRMWESFIWHPLRERLPTFDFNVRTNLHYFSLDSVPVPPDSPGTHSTSPVGFRGWYDKVTYYSCHSYAVPGFLVDFCEMNRSYVFIFFWPIQPYLTLWNWSLSLRFLKFLYDLLIYNFAPVIWLVQDFVCLLACVAALGEGRWGKT